MTDRMTETRCDAAVRIRPARRDDAGALLGLIGKLAEYERLTDAVRGDEGMLRKALFDDGAAEAILAELDREAIGYAVFFGTFSTFECRPGLWVEDLFVKPEWRRRGVGRALLGHIASTAVERGCARLEWAALDWNETALDFYEGLGAARLNEWQTLRLEGRALRRLAAP